VSFRLSASILQTFFNVRSRYRQILGRVGRYRSHLCSRLLFVLRHSYRRSLPASRELHDKFEVVHVQESESSAVILAGALGSFDDDDTESEEEEDEDEDADSDDDEEDDADVDDEANEDNVSPSEVGASIIEVSTLAAAAAAAAAPASAVGQQ
jgi:hypothetical protein